MRRFAIVCCILLSGSLVGPLPITWGQTQPPPAPPRQNFAPPRTTPPNADILAQIADRTAELRTALAGLRERPLPDALVAEVEVHLRAAESIVRLGEWYHPASGQWTLTTLEQGLERARQAAAGTAPWTEVPGQWNLRAYRSRIDASVQPYAVLLPRDYDRRQPRRLDLVLHGRDSSLTEAKFIATHRGPAPEGLTAIQLEVFGRGNNAYRWAGETDVFEALAAFRAGHAGVPARDSDPVDQRRIVLRGFSMGGAGTWHIGLHHPGLFCVLGPGAGFTTTRGYVADLPAQLPPQVSDTLHIYDAVDWAENALNVPIVCYSGEKDAQRQAAVNIETALRDFPEPLRFTHLVAPGLEHVLPPEWQQRAESLYQQFTQPGRPVPGRIRLVTYTPAYGDCDWLQVDALQQTYARGVIDARREGNTFTLTTTNARRLVLQPSAANESVSITIDGQALTANPTAATKTLPAGVIVERRGDTWQVIAAEALAQRWQSQPEKRRGLQGPIDDAFRGPFVVVGPEGKGWSEATDLWTRASLDQFDREWDRFFRGTLPRRKASEIALGQHRESHLVLFGDPQSNPLLAQLVQRLPVVWTAERLVVNGSEYDPRTHLPALIAPNPFDPDHYVVINSGHTFREFDLRGTNALLYPRWGDWAVVRATATVDEPTRHEVRTLGLFDENWRFGAGSEPARK